MKKINNNERLAYLAPEVLKQEFCMRCMQDASYGDAGAAGAQGTLFDNSEEEDY